MTTPEASLRRRSRFSWRRTMLLLFIAYVGLMLFGGCADKLLLYPSTDRIQLHGIDRVALRDPRLEIFQARPTEAPSDVPAAYVLAFTGNAGRAEYEADEVADEWRKQPVEIWAVNYPGYGQSAGPARLKSIPVAALQAYDELSAHAVGKPIYVSGRSLGTAAALYVASHRPVAGLVLENPPPLRSVIMGHGWWNLWLLAGPVALQVPSQLDSLANARNVTAPAVFLLAQRDTTVLPEYQQMVVGAFAGPKREIKLNDRDHNDPITADQQQELSDALGWLMQQKR